MKKIIVLPNSKELLNTCLSMNIDGVILPIKDLSVNSTYYLSLKEVQEIIKKFKDKEINILLNKNMTNDDLPLLEETLITLSKMNISKVLFYDLAVVNICKRLNLNLNLAIYQDHLNSSTNSNLFYKRRGINTSVITNDITYEEINEIAKEQSLMMFCYGYLPIFYSRRYLISNYLDYIKKKKKDTLYKIKDNNNSYIIEEEKYGTTIYTKEPINLINYIDKLDIDYIILSSIHIDDKEFLKVLNNYIEKRKDNKEHYTGFIDKKTVYKVEDYE